MWAHSVYLYVTHISHLIPQAHAMFLNIQNASQAEF